MKTFKQLMALLLVFVLVAACVPLGTITAFAAENDDTWCGNIGADQLLLGACEHLGLHLQNEVRQGGKQTHLVFLPRKLHTMHPDQVYELALRKCSRKLCEP